MKYIRNWAETPDVGDRVVTFDGFGYLDTFQVPEVGGTARVPSCSPNGRRPLGETFNVGAAEFRRVELHRYPVETAVGTSSGSHGIYTREK